MASASWTGTEVRWCESTAVGTGAGTHTRRASVVSTMYSPPKKTRTRLGVDSMWGRWVKGNFKVVVDVMAVCAMADVLGGKVGDVEGGEVRRGEVLTRCSEG